MVRLHPVAWQIIAKSAQFFSSVVLLIKISDILYKISYIAYQISHLGIEISSILYQVF